MDINAIIISGVTSFLSSASAAGTIYFMSNKEIINKRKIAKKFTKNVIAGVDGKTGFYNFNSTEVMEYYRLIPYFLYSYTYMFLHLILHTMANIKNAILKK